MVFLLVAGSSICRLSPQSRQFTAPTAAQPHTPSLSGWPRQATKPGAWVSTKPCPPSLAFSQPQAAGMSQSSSRTRPSLLGQYYLCPWWCSFCSCLLKTSVSRYFWEGGCIVVKPGRAVRNNLVGSVGQGFRAIFLMLQVHRCICWQEGEAQ